MRKEWRNVLGLGILFLTGTTAAIAQTDGVNELLGSNREAIRLTVEVVWENCRKNSGGADSVDRIGSVESDPECFLELSSGRVIEAIP
jgi:hypothetical protein